MKINAFIILILMIFAAYLTAYNDTLLMDKYSRSNSATMSVLKHLFLNVIDEYIIYNTLYYVYRRYNKPQKK